VILARLRSLGAALAGLGADATGDAGETARRTTLVAASVTVTVLAITWVVTYLALGRPLAAAIPLTYQVATVTGLIVISRGRGFRAFRVSQIAMMTVLPFALQWALGGWAASSVVSWWALVAALGAVLFLGAAGSRTLTINVFILKVRQNLPSQHVDERAACVNGRVACWRCATLQLKLSRCMQNGPAQTVQRSTELGLESSDGLKQWLGF